MRLSPKSILVLPAVFLIAISSAWYSILVIEERSAIAAYKQRIDDLSQLLVSAHERREVIEQGNHNHTAQSLFQMLASSSGQYQNVEFKELYFAQRNAFENEFEVSLGRMFSSKQAAIDKGTLSRHAETYYFIAKPIVANETCFVCHSDSIAFHEAARQYHPISKADLGKTVGINLLYAPMKNANTMSADDWKMAFLLLVSIFVVSLFLLNKMLRRSFITPLNQLKFAANTLGHDIAKEGSASLHGFMSALTRLKAKGGELGQLAGELLEVSDQVLKREQQLEAYNEELKSSEKEVAEHDRYISTILNRALDGIITVDSKGDIQTCNPQSLQVFGYKLEELVGKHISKLSAPGEMDAINKLLTECTQCEECTSMGDSLELRAQRKNKEQFWVAMGVTPVTLRQQQRYVIMVNDISARKLAEEKEKAALLAKAEVEVSSRAKSSFLANMSHEIRTPLGAIIGYAESILDKEVDSKQRTSAVHTIIRNGQYLLNIINDILDLSKIESSSFEVFLTQVSLPDIFAEVKRLMKMQAKEKGLKFDICYQFPIPGYIESDALRLKQILINLCGNAIKFTEQGEVTVNVSYQPDAHMLHIDIHDTGNGLTGFQKAQIFNEYVQADYLTVQQHKGTGLGLPISKKLAMKLGGDITVESEAGKGSCFTVALPIGKIDDAILIDTVPEEDEIEEFNHKNLQKFNVQGRVLVVEDNLDNQELVSYYLRRLGIDHKVVDNGLKAVEEALKLNYDLILMDMQMPVMNGVQAVESIRAKGVCTPVVMLTANAMQRDRDSCERAGCNGYITKPIDRSLFTQTVIKFLSCEESDVSNVELEAVYSTLLGDGDDEMDELIGLFVEGLSPKIEAISKALNAWDWEELESQFHKLKGSAANFGYPQLTNLAEQAEEYSRRKDKDVVGSLAVQVTQLCRQIELGMAKT